MKKVYESPELDIRVINPADIITWSPVEQEPDDVIADVFF